jgi:transcription initiation factor TFIIIB Brf1 subunit/transcription initiation factor TFIIB
MEIKDFKKKTWRELVSVCKDKHVLFALSEKNELVDAAKLREQNGVTASACYVCAVLMAEKSAMMAIDAAAFHFMALAKKHRMPSELHERIRILEEQIC